MFIKLLYLLSNMVEVELKNWGHSIGVILPKHTLEDLDVEAGDKIEIEVVSKKRVDGFGMFRGARPFEREDDEHDDLW